MANAELKNYDPNKELVLFNFFTFEVKAHLGFLEKRKLSRTYYRKTFPNFWELLGEHSILFGMLEKLIEKLSPKINNGTSATKDKEIVIILRRVITTQSKIKKLEEYFNKSDESISIERIENLFHLLTDLCEATQRLLEARNVYKQVSSVKENVTLDESMKFLS